MANLVLDTCLALLFLKRGNLVADLTTKLPFDPNALTSSINEQLAPPMPSSVDSALTSTLKTAETASKTPEPPNSLVRANNVSGSFPAAESSTSEEAETRSRSGWLWLLVLLAMLLFIACGVLLTNYSLSHKKPSGRPRRNRHAKDRARGPHRSAKQGKR